MSGTGEYWPAKRAYNNRGRGRGGSNRGGQPRYQQQRYQRDQSQNQNWLVPRPILAAPVPLVRKLIPQAVVPLGKIFYFKIFEITILSKV